MDLVFNPCYPVFQLIHGCYFPWHSYSLTYWALNFQILVWGFQHFFFFIEFLSCMMFWYPCHLAICLHSEFIPESIPVLFYSVKYFCNCFRIPWGFVPSALTGTHCCGIGNDCGGHFLLLVLRFAQMELGLWLETLNVHGGYGVRLRCWFTLQDWSLAAQPSGYLAQSPVRGGHSSRGSLSPLDMPGVRMQCSPLNEPASWVEGKAQHGVYLIFITKG